MFFVTVTALVLAFFALPSFTHAATATISASPSSLYAGGQVTVTWSSSGAWRCIGTGFSTNNATSGSKTFTVYGSGVKTYSVSCYDQSPQCALVLKSTSTADAGNVTNTCGNNISYSPNGSCYPKWGTCRITSRSGGRYVEGEGYFGATYTTQNYRCEGGCSTATASDSVTVNTPPPPPSPGVDLTVSPSTVTAGGTAVVSWNATRAYSCNGSGFSTNGATSGSVTVTPTSNTNYSISCQSETFSSSPGTWEHFYTDYTDYWCPVSDSTFNRTYGFMPNCPTNSVQRNNSPRGEHGTTRTNNGDPSGMACTGSEECKLNANHSCVVTTRVYRCNGGNTTPNYVNDSASVSYNQRPLLPTITGATSGTVNTSYTFGFRATDPDGNNVRYQIDWDDDGSTVDGSGGEITSYSSSGWTANRSYSWSTPGTYSFKAYTRDNNSAVSSPLWGTHTITIGDPTPECADGVDNDGDGLIDLNDFACADEDGDDENDDPQCSDGIDNDGDGRTDTADYGCNGGGDNTESPNPQCSDGIDNNGNGKIDHPADPACTSPSDNNEEVLPEASISLSVNPALTQEGSSVSLNWTASDVETDSCSLTGTNGDSWTLSGTSGSETSSVLSNETIFTLQCTDLEEDPVATSATVKLVPQFGEI